MASTSVFVYVFVFHLPTLVIRNPLILAMIKRYDHANEERYGGAIEALDKAGDTSRAEALAAARWKQKE